MIFSNSRTSIVFKKSYVNSIKLRGKYFIDRQTNIQSEVDMIPTAWCSKNKERKKKQVHFVKLCETIASLPVVCEEINV